MMSPSSKPRSHLSVSPLWFPLFWLNIWYIYHQTKTLFRLHFIQVGAVVWWCLQLATNQMARHWTDHGLKVTYIGQIYSFYLLPTCRWLRVSKIGQLRSARLGQVVLDLAVTESSTPCFKTIRWLRMKVERGQVIVNHSGSIRSTDWITKASFLFFIFAPVNPHTPTHQLIQDPRHHLNP